MVNIRGGTFFYRLLCIKVKFYRLPCKKRFCQISVIWLSLYSGNPVLTYKKVFTACYSWSLPHLIIRKVGNSVNILVAVLIKQPVDRRTPVSENNVSFLYVIYAISPLLNCSSFNQQTPNL